MSIFGGRANSSDPFRDAMPYIAKGMAGGDSAVPTPTIASAPTTTATTTATATSPSVAPPSAPASPAQAPSYAARAAGRSGPRGGIASTILTSGAGLTTRASTGQKTLLGA